MNRFAVLLIVVLASGIAAEGASAQGPFVPHALRTHSRVVTYDRGQVLVRGFEAAVTRATNGQLQVRVSLAVSNETSQTVRRVLRVGRCTRGPAGAPVCPATATFGMRLVPGATTSLVRTATLDQPSFAIDAIEAAVDRTGRWRPSRDTDGELLLMGAAWRGAGTGRTYGVVLTDLARTFDFSIAKISEDVARADLDWTGSAAKRQTATATLSTCAGADCSAPRSLKPRLSRSGRGHVGGSYGVHRGGADSLQLTAAGGPELGGGQALSATLPWPT